MEALDKLDRQILRSLQADGRATYDQIADGVGLSAWINVRLEKASGAAKRNPMDEFRASVQAWPEVVECMALTGEMDFLLRLVVSDMTAYSRFMMDTLLKHPSVQDCKTSFVMDRVKSTTAIPV
jgi:Lrp/AsnC family leucine-responsive transcriptional regulator